MVDKYGRGPKSQVRTRASVSGFVVHGAPSQSVVPYKLNSYSMNAWHIENGWPTPGAGAALATNAYDITPTPETFPGPQDVLTNADARWTAQDYSGGSWGAFQGTGTWTGTVTKKANYKYKADGISYDVPALRFDSDDANYLTANLTAMSGVAYTMVLVFKPYPAPDADGDSDSETSYGLIAPATAATGQPSLRVRNDKLKIKQSSELDAKQPWSRAQRSFAYYMNRGAPSYLVWTAGANHFNFYLGTGPSTLEHYGLNDPHDVAKVFNFKLGTYSSDTTHTADMLLFDVGFYNDVLTGLQASAEVATLAAAYGGS